MAGAKCIGLMIPPHDDAGCNQRGHSLFSLVSTDGIDVYVADTDRDGLRDGIDACPRDPLNNVEGGCTRTSAAYLVLDDLITLGDVATETRGDEFHITATFTNTSDTAIGNPFFEVTELTGGNLLVNADAGPSGRGRHAFAGCRRRHPVTWRIDDGDVRHRPRHTRSVQLPRERQGRRRALSESRPTARTTGPTSICTTSGWPLRPAASVLARAGRTSMSVRTCACRRSASAGPSCSRRTRRDCSGHRSVSFAHAFVPLLSRCSVITSPG